MDDEVFAAMLAECRGVVERFVYAKTPSKPDGEDVLQESGYRRTAIGTACVRQGRARLGFWRLRRIAAVIFTENARRGWRFRMRT